MVREVIKEKNVDGEKWGDLLLDLVNKAVENVKPSSQILRDSMNFNSYIKIKIVNWKDMTKSSYINGIVLSSHLADR